MTISTVAADVTGFCSKCGLFRQDTAEGVNVTDCRCTALRAGHTEECFYVKSVSCPVVVGMPCKTHGFDSCEECECDCGARKENQ
jgi:hypothetical protein